MQQAEAPASFTDSWTTGRSLPDVLVLPRQKVKGLFSLDPGELAEAKAYSMMSFEDAFGENHDTDAHFTCYRVVDSDGTVCASVPRLNKSVLNDIEARGGRVEVTVLAVDVDNAGHGGSTEATARRQHGAAQRVKASKSPASRFLLWYPTRGGCRFVYVLTCPLSPAQAEASLAGLRKELRWFNVLSDENCKEWNRHYRLPFVFREDDDGKHHRTWEGDYMGWVDCIVDEDARLDPDDLPKVRVTARARSVAAPALSLPQPDSDSVRTLLFESADPPIPSRWYLAAKVKSRGAPYYACCFEGAALASAGERNARMLSYVGSAVHRLYDVPGSTSEHLYALFEDAVVGLEPDAQTPDWSAVLWDQISRTWPRECAKRGG